MSTPAEELTRADTDLKRRQSTQVEREWDLLKQRLALDRLQALSQSKLNDAKIEEMRANVRTMDVNVQSIRAETEFTTKRSFWVPILAVSTCATGSIIAVVAGVRLVNWAFGA